MKTIQMKHSRTCKKKKKKSNQNNTTPKAATFQNVSIMNMKIKIITTKNCES